MPVQLKDLLRISSVSTLEEHTPDVRRAAEFVAAELGRIGFEHVEVIPTKGHPLVYADWLHAHGKPTVLCYAHYDVQPPDPLDEWVTPPFEPTERNQNIYARGAVDDKGQLWMQLKAFEALMKSNGGMPINVKVLIEGEEEVGGESIAEYVAKHKDRLKSDFALITDTELFAPNLPTLCVGLRGLVYTELEAIGSKTDLHSGMYGGAAPNPFFGLIEIISKLKDANGKILIPGFYDRVKAPSKDELKAWKRLPFKDKDFLKNEVGSTTLTGEPKYPTLYRLWARPDARSPRHARWIHRRGREDGDPVERGGEGFHAPGARPGSGRHPQEVREVHQEDHAQGHPDKDQSAQQRAGVGGQHRQQVHQGRHRSHA